MLFVLLFQVRFVSRCCRLPSHLFLCISGPRSGPFSRHDAISFFAYLIAALNLLDLSFFSYCLFVFELWNLVFYPIFGEITSLADSFYCNQLQHHH